MRTIAIVVNVLSFLQSCSEHTLENKTVVEISERQKIRKRIKQIKTRIEDKEIFETDKPDYVYHNIKRFDTSGLLIEELNFDKDSVMNSHLYQKTVGDTLFLIREKKEKNSDTTFYTSEKETFLNGLRIEKYSLSSWRHEESFSQDGYSKKITPLPFIRNFSYDEEQRISVEENVSDGEKNKVVYEYDSRGNRIAKIAYKMPENVKKYSHEFVFDDKNRMVKKMELSYTDGVESISFKRFYRYNDMDSLLSESHYRNENDCFLKVTYEYDTLGRKVLETAYNDLKTGDSTLVNLVKEYYYARDGNTQIVMVYTPEGELMFTTRNTYDSFGNLIEVERLSHFINLDKRKVQHMHKVYFEYQFYEN